VDVVSNGRLIAGFGAGYVAAEFAAAGVPLAGRGARMEDYIRAMRVLWSMDRPAYQGPFVSFTGIGVRPRPRQRPAPPIVIGGEAPAALRRAVMMAEGWYGFNLGVPETGRLVRALRPLATECGRPAGLGPLELTVTPTGPLDKAAADRYAELGDDRLLPEPDASPAQRHAPVPVDRILRNIDAVAQQILGT
jgi:alkanesulfonate monooxygenase SsuD/methylene tetrahydromethanopterin reductase-like flavin-dependent oxidoreductase (luciferase family)